MNNTKIDYFVSGITSTLEQSHKGFVDATEMPDDYRKVRTYCELIGKLHNEFMTLRDEMEELKKPRRRFLRVLSRR